MSHLTGQLARGLDLGLGAMIPAPRRKPARPARQAPRRPDVAKVAAALRKLLGQLAGPIQPIPRSGG